MIPILAKNETSATLCAMANGLKIGQFEYVKQHGQLSLLTEGRHVWACLDYQDNPECLKIITELKRRKLKLVKPHKVKFS